MKELGTIRAKKFKQRLDDLAAITNLEEAKNLPGKYHELTSDRKGTWACSLDGAFRLIFQPHNNPIPTNDNGQYIWVEIVGVEIMEIIDYH